MKNIQVIITNKDGFVLHEFNASTIEAAIQKLLEAKNLVDENAKIEEELTIIKTV